MGHACRSRCIAEMYAGVLVKATYCLGRCARLSFGVTVAVSMQHAPLFCRSLVQVEGLELKIERKLFGRLSRGVEIQ